MEPSLGATPGCSLVIVRRHRVVAQQPQRYSCRPDEPDTPELSAVVGLDQQAGHKPRTLVMKLALRHLVFEHLLSLWPPRCVDGDHT